MSIYKRGNVYWFSFWHDSKRIQRSTGQRNRTEARKIEAAYRTKLAKEDVGIREPDPVPGFEEFADRFLQTMREWHRSKPNTVEYYETGVKRLLDFDVLRKARLDQVDEGMVAAYVTKRRQERKPNGKPFKPATINRHLEVLRRMLRLAAEWKVIGTAPVIRRLPGEVIRERVLTHQEEEAYLRVASEPLRTVALVLLDTGMRPEEVFRMDWENIHFEPAPNSRCGYIFNPFGKSKNARRYIPMTNRVKNMLEVRWVQGGRPEKGWVFSSKAASGHLESLKSQHAKALRLSGVFHFVLYSLRHTMLTRLGQAGADPFTIQKIAGHSNINISTRYVHPTPEMVERAFEKLEDLNLEKNVALEERNHAIH